MKKSTLFLFLLIFQLHFGQERNASILLTDNSSVEGYGEIKDNKIYFRLELSEKPEIWTANDAKGLLFKGFGFSERYEYVLPEKEKKAILMQVIEEGSLTVYQDVFMNSTYLNGTVISNMVKSYYIKKAKDTKAIEIGGKLKQKCSAIFSDCEDAMYKLNEEESPTKEDIIDLVKFYNRNCTK